MACGPFFLKRPFRPDEPSPKWNRAKTPRPGCAQVARPAIAQRPGPAPRSLPNGSCAYKWCASGQTASEVPATCSPVPPHTELRSAPAGYSDLHCRAVLAGYSRCAHTAALLTDDDKLSANARWSLRARFDRKIANHANMRPAHAPGGCSGGAGRPHPCSPRRPAARCHHARGGLSDLAVFLEAEAHGSGNRRAFPALRSLAKGVLGRKTGSSSSKRNQRLRTLPSPW